MNLRTPRLGVCDVSKIRWWSFGLLIVGAALAAVIFWAGADESISDAERAVQDAAEMVVDEPSERRIVAFCSACHAMPAASSFARDAWHDEVMQGYHFYAKSGRTDLDPPPPAQAIAYFRRLATKDLIIPSTADSKQSFGVVFREEQLSIDSKIPVPPAIACLKWLPARNGDRGLLIAGDMRLGTIHGVTVDRGRLVRTEIGPFGHPCHVEPCDLDGDGLREFVVADLGSFDPDDHDRGRVLWDPLKPGRNRKPSVLAAGLGRIADVRPADFDNDGDSDLVVAEFGWQQTGGIHLLWNTGVAEGVPQFRSERVYARSGAIHVPPFDFDGDQRLDVVALVSQEHERVELLLNRSPLPWEVRTLWAAPDPAFGLSGLELVDLDNDGDRDILFTNGDTFDSLSIKPSHGIQWLRNDGDLKFTHQRIADLSGAYRAIAADFDNDGDLDFVASTWLPRQSIHSEVDVTSMPALVVFEQTKPMQFERHTLQQGRPCFAALEVGDFDRDGDPDIAVGWFLSSMNQSTSWVSVWWNDGSAATKTPR